MRIEDVYLKNFGIFKEERFSLDPGSKTIVFSGDNGSGKSTIFDAFKMNVLDAYDGSLKDFINWSASGFLTEFRFTVGGKRVRSIMAYNGTSSERELHVEGEARITETKAAVARLAKLVDPKRFLATSFVQQHELDIIATGPAERREYLKRLWDLSFVRALTYLSSRIDEAKAQAARLQGERAGLLSREYEFVDLVPPPLSLIEVEALEGQRSALLREREAFALSFDRLTSLRAEVSALDATMEARKEPLARRISDVAAQEKAVAVLEKGDDLRSEVEGLEAKLGDDLSALSLKVENIEKDIAEAEAKLVRPPAFSPEEHDARIKGLGDASARLIAARRRKELVERGICSECQRPFDAQHAEHATADVEALIAEVAARQILVDESGRKKQAREAALKDNDLLERRLVALRASMPDRAQREYDLRHTAEMIIASVRSAHDVKLAGARSTLDAMRVRVDETNALIAEAEAAAEAKRAQFDEETARWGDTALLSAAVDEKLARVQVDLAAHAEVLARNAVAVATNERSEQQRAADVVRLGQLDGEQAGAEKLGERLIAAYDILRKELPSYIIAREVKVLERYINVFLEQTYRGRYKVVIEEAKDALKILYGPKHADVRHSASGYEKQIFSLAWKFAKEKMDGIGLLLLDEVDSEASDANSQLFYSVIGKLPYEQVLAISHRERTRELLRGEQRAQVFEIVGGRVAS